jgi:chromosome segregation ATPase
MKSLRFTSVSLSIACILAVAMSPLALAETGSTGNAKALLEAAKKSALERKLAAKQTELDRLGEDLKKGKQEIDELQKSVYSVGNAVTEATGHLNRLGAQKKTHTQELELVNLRIDAEKLKSEGLKLLSTAHGKSMEALAKRTEELDLKTTLVAAEIRALSGTGSTKAAAPEGKGSKAKAAPTITDLRKQLVKAENATSIASYRAREAMEAASAKLQQAEAAAAKAEKKQTEIGLEKNPSFPGGNDPLKRE